MSEDGDGWDIETEFRFVRWVEDPAGVSYCIEGVKSFGVGVIVLPLWENAGARVQRILGVLNKGDVRMQRPRTVERCHLEVTRFVGDRGEPVLDESLDDMDVGRRAGGITRGRDPGRDLLPLAPAHLEVGKLVGVWCREVSQAGSRFDLGEDVRRTVPGFDKLNQRWPNPATPHLLSGFTHGVRSACQT